MEILKLKLLNFRNFKQETFTFSPTKNIIIGENGEGKTNIVESIYCLALIKSFRTTNDFCLINENAEYSIIEGKIKEQLCNDFKLTIEKKKKRVFINNNQIKRFSDYISQINIISFTSEDLRLIKTGPGNHRLLMNMELSQFDNQYLKNLSIYNKLLKQRNTYLKNDQDKIKMDYLFILTNKLIEYGILIYNQRKKYIENINENLNMIFEKITNKKKLILKYESDFNNLTKSEIENKYRKLYKTDINYGNTSFGVHLDDYLFYYNGTLAKEYFSEGELKCAVIAFKLAEMEVFIKNKNKTPILILDDLFSNLDDEKIKKIFNLLKKEMQIFITTTDINNIDKKTLKNSKVIKLKNKNIEEIDYE